MANQRRQPPPRARADGTPPPTRIPADRWRRAGLPALLVLLGVGAAACSRGEANEAESALQSATVQRQTIVSSVNATGTVEPIRYIDIKSQASGEILELPVELGDFVERGNLLVRIDPRDVRNAYEQAEADLDVARARFEVAERQLERTRALRDSAVVTEDELEAAILEHANARAVLVKAETNLELAEDRLQDVTLRAPISGTVVERNVEEGQIITGAREVTGGTVLMRMADLSEVQVRTLVDETDIGKVEAGLPAEITVEAFPDRTFRGSVLKVEPQAVVEQNVTMFAVLTRIRNEEDLLRPGMNADVEMVVGQEENVLALPNAAVKLPDEARQLARALGLEDAMEEAASGRVAARGAPDAGGPGGASAADSGEGGGAASGDGHGGRPAPGGEGEAGDGLPSPERIRSMSQEERREMFQSLDAAQRRQLFQRMQEMRERQEAAARANPARPKPAFVFRRDEAGRLTLHPITVGLSNYDYTQVIAGLEEGDQVVSIPLSLIQQQDLLNRIRSRSGVPGVSRD